MSTEATGGGQPGADGAGEPEVAAEGTEPAATTLAAPTAWDTAAPSAWGAPVAASTEGTEPGALVPDQAPTPDETTAEAGDDAVADDALAPAELSPAAAGDPSTASEASAAGSGSVVPDDPSQAAAEPDKDVQPSEPDEPSDADETLGVYGSDVLAENNEPDKAEGTVEVRESHEVNEADVPDDAVEYDEDYEHSQSEAAAGGEEYGKYENEAAEKREEAEEPRSARRWPRVLLALGFVALAAVIVGGAIVIVGSVTHGFKKPVKVTYKESALFSLKTGECFNPQGQSYSLISCDSPHQAEVFATFTLSGTNYPGATAIATQASDGCTSRLTAYVNPQLALSLTSTYVYPDTVAWQAGTRTVICEVRASSGTLTGSVRSASAS